MPKKTEQSEAAAAMAAKFSSDKSLKDVVKLGGGTLLADTPYYISTQAPTIDYIIGRPGIPAGKLTTIFGREASGKSTIGYHLLSETQKRGGLAVLIDSEQRFPRDRAHLMGIDADQLIVIDGATAEQSFEAIEEMAKTMHKDFPNTPVTYVFDSLAGSVPKKRMEADIDAVMVGQMAKLVSAVLPRIKLEMAKSAQALVIVNQLRSRVQMADPTDRSTYERIKVVGKSQTMLAEWPLIFESALMLYVHSVSNLGKDKNQPTGLRSRVVNRKCGLAPREMWWGEIDIDYRTGIDIPASQFDLLLRLGYLKAKGARYEVDGAGEPSFYRKDFAEVMAKHPEFQQILDEAPTRWLRGEETAVEPEEDDD